MKKVLALILAVLMVTSCMVFTVAAEDAATETPVSFVPVSDCDTADGWTGTNFALSAEKTQGVGSVTTSMTEVATTPGALNLTFIGPARDISAMKTLVFDLYISNVGALNNVSWQIELRDTDGSDRSELLLERNNLQALTNTELVNGWNRVEIPLSVFIESGADVATNPVDLTQWNFFRMYTENNGITYGAEGLTVGLDNMYFTDETTDSYFPVEMYHDNAGVIGVAHDNATAAKAGYYCFGRPNGDSQSIVNYNTLEFDVVIGAAAANDIVYKIALTQQYAVAQEKWTKTFTLSELNGGDLEVGKSYHFAIPYADFTVVEGLDTANFRRMTIYNVGGGAEGDDATVSFNGFVFTSVVEAPEYYANDILVLDADTKSGTGFAG